eukprot:gene2099-17672_t
MAKQQMIDRFSSHRDILRSFQCLMPECPLNSVPEENRRCLEILFQEYGPDKSFGGIKEEVFQKYSLFQARFKESSGVEITMKKRIAILKNNRTVSKWKEMSCQCTSVKHLFKFLYISKLYKNFPNLYKLYQVLLAIPVTSAEAESSFSKSKLIKSYQRTTMNQQGTSNLAVISMARQRAVDFIHVLDIFASMTHR